MGYGDELMAAGQAKQTYLQSGLRVRILDRRGHRRWNDLWEGLSYIARPTDVGVCASITNGGGARPYIAAMTPERWTWRAFKPEPGELILTHAEREKAAANAGRVIVEPNLKARASPNKDWGWARWSKLVFLLAEQGVRVSQLWDGQAPLLAGVDAITTTSYREAAAVVSTSRASILPEGGLHHAAAAFGRPSIVLFGGFISPEQTGYAMHRNLFTGGEPCGMRTPCRHCAQAMAKISPEEVIKQLKEIL